MSHVKNQTKHMALEESFKNKTENEDNRRQFTRLKHIQKSISKDIKKANQHPSLRQQTSFFTSKSFWPFQN